MSARFVLAFFATILGSMLVTPAVAVEINKATRLAYESRVFQSDDGKTLPYRIMPPAQIEAGKKYPIVLFLHGAGERGTDNEIQLVHAASEFARTQRRQDYPAFVVFPQCPAEQRWVESPWDLPSGKGEFADEPSKAMKLTLQLMDSLVSELPVDTDRLYVCGLSMGGQGAWFAASAKPHRFAAMIEVCGGGDPDWANRYAGIPIWAFHGQDDSVVPISRGREMIAALAVVGHHPELRYCEYPGVGHDSWTRTYRRDDVFAWLFSKRKQ